jgi:uncharacterized protein (DUF58 family)
MSLLTPEELRELRRVHLQAGRRVDAMFAGDYRSAVRGQGMEFEEVRPYQPGDDVRHLDWNVTARTGDPFIKVFREERQLTVLLVVDVSGSTRLGCGGRDGKTTRQLQLARVAGGLAYATFRNRDHVGLVTFSDQMETYLSPRRTRGHVWAVIQAVFQGAATSRGTDLSEALRYVARIQRRRAVIVVVSDFLDEGPWDTRLGALSRRHTVHAVCMTDPLDHALAGLGLTHIVDSETAEPRLVDAKQLVGTMSASSRIQRLRRAGVDAFAVSTNDDVFSVLHRQFQQRGTRR